MTAINKLKSSRLWSLTTEFSVGRLRNSPENLVACDTFFKLFSQLLRDRILQLRSVGFAFQRKSDI
jgi:hypothetical protein